MRASTSQLTDVVSSSQSSYLLVDVLHGTDRVAQDVVPVSWSLSGDLSRDPKYTGRLRFVHESVAGESWVPDGATGVLSPFRATLILTHVTVAGGFEERTQLGFFDVVAVPFAEDTVAHVNARYTDGVLSGGLETVVTSTVDVDIASLDNRVLADSLVSPATVTGSAVTVWRSYGLLPVAAEGADTLNTTTFPAEQGSRLDLVQACAKTLGGVAVVNSRGQWALVDDDAPVLELQAWGDQSTVIDVSATVDLDGFYNVVVGDYEDVNGVPIRSVWEAPGRLSPTELGRRWVRYHSSDTVRTQAVADATTRAIGLGSISQELDVPITCIHNPLLEVGDRVTVTGWIRPLAGVAQEVASGDGSTMRVVVRVRRTP